MVFVNFHFTNILIIVLFYKTVPNVAEFVPYVFQILSMLLELHGPGQIPEPYLALYPCLLAPVLWERPGNVHPLVRLLRAFIHKCAPQQMQNVLKIVSCVQWSEWKNKQGQKFWALIPISDSFLRKQSLVGSEIIHRSKNLYCLSTGFHLEM